MRNRYSINVLKSIVLTICCGLYAFSTSAQEEVIDFAGLANGTLLSDQYAGIGVHISADADDGHPDLQMVFNTNLSGTADPDLEVGVGNIAIFPYNTTDINDQPDGGKIYFEFDEDVTVISFDFIDKDNGTNGKVKVYDEDNDQIGSQIDFYDAGDGSVQTVNVNRSGVRKLKIDHDDSGGITNIRFTRDNGPPCGIDCYIPAEGELCFASPDAPEASAQSIWTSEWSTDANTGLMTIRVTLAPTFVDNTYGSNTIGWPSGNHTFNHLKGSDHLQLALYDADDVKQLEFKMDYIDTDGSVPSGYASLGLDGNGDMIEGNSTYIVDITSSLDKNFNEYGYVLTTNSPATDADYTPNPSYPNWIYEVWYEAVIDLQAFGNVGFGYPEMTSVHASPSKTGNNSEDVVPVPCIDCDEVTISVSAQVTDPTECEEVENPGGDYDGCCQSHGDHDHISAWNLEYVGPSSPATIEFYTSGGNYGTTTYNGTHSVGDFILIEADNRFDSNSEFTINGSTVEVHTSCSEATNVGFGIDSNGDFVPNPDPNDSDILFIIHGLATPEDGWCGTQSGSGSMSCNGIADVTASGGTAPYSYLWSDGSTQEDRNDLCEGTYTVTVTDANGCTGTTTVTVTCPPPCDNVTDPGVIGYEQTGCAPFDPAELISVEDPSGGSGALEFVWLKSTNGGSNYTVISGANGLTYNPGVITQTTWFRRCARRAGCEAYVGESNWVMITVGTTGVDVSVSGTDVSCDSDPSNECEVVHYENGGHAVWFNDLNSGTRHYKFEGGHGTLVENEDGTGHFSGIIYNTSDADKRWSVDINLTDVKSWSEWSAMGGDWKGNATTVGNNYQNWNYYEIGAGSRLIGLGDWDGDEISIVRNSNALQYRVQVGIAANDKNGNYGLSAWFDFAGDHNGHGDFNFDIQNCVERGCDGAATASASGGTAPYTYIWDNGMTTSSIDGLCPGQYCVTVVDANGCESEEACVTIGDRPVCCNVTDPGEIEASGSGCAPFDPPLITSVEDPSGGLGDLEIVWIYRESNGNGGWTSWQMIPGATGLEYNPGPITVTTQFRRCARREGCSSYMGESNILTMTVTGPCCENVTDGGEIEEDQQNCGPFDPAVITSVTPASGGIGPVEYAWYSGPCPGIDPTNAEIPSGFTLIPGANGETYDPPYTEETVCYIRVARNQGCEPYEEESNIVRIDVLPGITASCTSENGNCANGNRGSASVSVSGGESPYTYAWSNGATTASIGSLPAGTYSVTVTDANGCEDNCSVSITTTPCCNVTDGGEIEGEQENCGPFDPAAITSIAPATGGIGPVEYVWLWNSQNVPINNGNNGWVEIPNSNSETYDPGMLSESRCFIRCARNQGCVPYIGESNVVCITINEGPVATCSKVDGDCNNNNEGSASVSVSGGEAPYTYAWSNGATTASISGLDAGTYSVTVTDANGCEADCSVTVTTTPCCNVTDPGEIAASQENCGGFDPEPFTSISLPSGGLGDIEYVWIVRTIGGSWSTVSGANGPTYDAPYTDVSLQYRRCARRSGCNSYVGESNILTITVNPGPVATCSSVNGDCNNNNEASASVSVSGGTAPYTYAWSNGATSSSISGLSAGTYSVTVTDANGCSDDCSVTVTTTPCCNATDPGTVAGSQENCGPFDPVAFTSIAPASGGLGDIEYQWYEKETETSWMPIPGATSATYDPGMTSVHTQFRRCARRSGCTDYDVCSNVLEITIHPNNINPTCSMTPAACAGSATGSASVVVQGGTTPYTYLWSNGGTTSTISGLTAGTYSVTVTDVNGCTGTCDVVVTDAPNLVANCSSVNGDCNNNNEASASVSVSGGEAPYTYAWSNGATTASINGLDAGTYSVTVTDANGCSTDCSVTVTTTPCCNVTDGGEIAADQENCGPFDPAPFTSLAPATGGIGPVEYLWLRGECGTSVSTWTAIPNSNSETYDAGMITETTCFIRCSRNVGCTQWVGESNIITLTVNPDDVVATCSSTPADCNGASTGSVSVSPSGGTAPYTVLWSNGATTMVVNNLMAGSYSVTVTDANGCSNTCTAEVEEPAALVANCSSVNGDCNNNNEASASVSVSGGTSPYTYAWSNGSTTSSISGLAAGSYSVTVTDANGCATDCSVTVTTTPCCNVTDPGEIAASQENCGGFDPERFTSVSLPSGGLGDLEYVWLVREIGGSWSEIPNSDAPEYDAPYTNISLQYRRCARRSGCNTYVGESNILTITVYPEPVVTCSSVNGDCNNNNEASASVSVSGGTAPYSYAWSNGATTASINGLTAGTYSVTVTDANGCSDDCSVTVTTTPCCDVTDPGTVEGSQEGCGPFDPVAFTSIAPATGGLGDVVYQWYQKETETSWMPIPGANGETYDPGLISINSQFRRCARRVGCPEFEVCSNVLEIEIRPVPQVNCTSVSGNCSNGNGASATVNVQGGTAPYSFAWSNGGTTQTIEDLAEGTYSVTVTDYFGCEASCDVTVTVEGCCNVTDGGTIAGVQENCGPFDPAAITSVAPATGGIGPVEYIWLQNSQNVPINNGQNGWVEIPGSNSETFDPGYLTETTCFIRCARNEGCTTYIGESNVICVVVNPEPVATCTSVNGDCNNNNEASASVSVSGGTAPYSYAWSNGATTASISGLAAGTYSVTVTDINGCTSDCSVTVTTNPCCDVTEPGTVEGSQSNCGPFDPVAFTSITPASGGLGDIEYQWYQKETETSWMPIPGATGETYDPGMISINSQFKRCARRTGCPEYEVCSNVLEIEIFPTPTANCTGVDGNCNNNNEASASVTVQGGTAPYTYAWSNGETTASISGLAAGTYSVTITDYNGCEANCDVTVDVVPCCNVTDGGEINNAQENCGPFDPDAITSITPATGGLGDLEYIWLMNDENVPLNNGNNGWVEIPNSNSEIYDPGMITETTCFIRCARREGCTVYIGESNVVCMVVNEGPTATCSSTDSDCNGSGSGTATVSATGGEAPYSYAWSNGGTTATISGLMAGTYSVVVTDANGCEADCSVTVSEPSGLAATCDASDATCAGESNGSLSVNATGGSAPYTYAWSNGATTATVDNVAAGTYSVTVTDANGCSATCSATVNEPAALSASCSNVDGDCQNNNEGSASVSVSGGVEPYTVLWSTGATTMNISNLTAGSYSVTVTDANGCEATCSVTVEVEPCCNVTDGGEIEGAQENCGPFDPAAITSVTPATGGLGDLEYIWLMNDENVPLNNGQNGWVEIPGSNSETYDPGMLTETTCFIRCARREGCTVYVGESNVICITIFEEPVASCTPVNGDCNNGNVSSASVSVSGGTEPYTYEWSNGETTASISDLADGTYSVTVTDANGCASTCDVTVSSTPCCNVTDGGEIEGAQENCGPFDPAAITSVTPATGGLGDLEYIWLMNDENVPLNNGQNGWVEIPGSNSETYDPGMLTETTCFIRCARREGCTVYVGESNVICITIFEEPVATCTPTNGDCNNGNLASASVSVSGGTEPYAYEWSNGATTASIENLISGTYSVTVTDANGCTSTCDVTVEVEGCCNVTDGGEIEGVQENCGPFDPAAITSIAPATGGLGDLEYIWLMNDENVPLNNGNNGWVEIPGSNSESYDPGMLSETTCFIRCARREGCNVYVGESNVICITVYPEVEVACNPTHGDCSNNGVGAVSTTISGGTAPFTYAWSNGATTADISGLGEGTYSVTVTDANGCMADCSVTIVSEPCCNVTDGGEIEGVQENCGPFDPAAITSVVPATGGIGPVEYIWLWNANNVPINNGNNGWVEIPGSNSETYDPGMLTESRCFIRCARNVGCTTYIGESNVICITVNEVPELTCEGVDGDCNNNNEASASVSVDGGEAPYTYAWSNGETTASISGLDAGTYSVTVTDANGCEATCSVTVEVTPCCNVTDPGEIAADQSDCGPFDPEPFTSVAPATGGIGPVEYLWLRGECGTPVNTWTAIPNSNSETLDVDSVFETTCFIRCSRNVGCTQWVGESNIITITVGPGCCDNVTDGGEIGYSQENCGPFDPDAFVSLVDPTGGSGDLEFVWLMNDENVPINNGNNGWVEIPNSNSATYDPGMITETTCFIRCVRRSGCEAYVGESNVICITINPADLMAVCTPVNGDCNNQNVGSASVSATGGEEPYTYEWSNGETTASISGLAAGTYTVTVTDANGCSATCDAIVEVEECCNITDGGEIAEDQENCGPFEAATLTSVVDPSGGLGDMEIIWIYRPGTSGPWQMIPGSTGLTYEPGLITETTQFRRCARREGCSPYAGESNIITITILPAVEIECSSISGDCGNGNLGSASVEVLNGTAPYTYEWSNGETTAEITGLEEGIYTVTVTDANGCTASCAEEVIITPCCNVTDPGEIAADQSSCVPFDPAPFASLAPASGGIGPVEYLWLRGECGTPVGTWTPIANSNSETLDVDWVEETTCFIRCARNSGCEPWVGESNIITITIENALSIECSSISGDCGNGNAASASVEVLDGAGPFTYEWSNGETTAEITDLEEGVYTVTVTDANGCTATCTEEVIVTPCCNVTDPGEIGYDQENCGPFDPEPFVSLAPATGGIGPVEYLWLRGECGTPIADWTPIANSNSETLDVDSVFETTCFIRCARNSSCEPWVGESNIITITVHPVLELSCNGVDGDCTNDNIAMAVAHASGGTEPFTYLWSNGETTNMIDSLEAGTYTVVVTDANGCEATCEVTVDVTPCCNVTDGGEVAEDQENCGPFDPEPIVSVTPATGGIGPVEYAWYSGPCDEQVDPTAIPAGFTLIEGANGESYDPPYTEESTCYIRVARKEGCEEWIGESNIVSIIVNDGPELACSSGNGNCENGNVGWASVTVSGAPSPFTYEWSTGEPYAAIDSLVEGTYTVVVTDANGCVDSCSVDVEVVPCCNVTDGGEIAEDQENCGPFDPDPIVSVTPATGGIGPVEYAWYSGPCDENIDPTFAPTEQAIPAGFSLIEGANGESYDPPFTEETTCYIRVARNLGCEDYIGESNIITITVNDGPQLGCSSENGTCENGNIGSASVLVSGAPTPFSYAWSNGATTAGIENLEEGTYTVIVTDGNGCVDSCSVDVEVVPCCNVTDGGEIAESQESCGPFDPEELTSISPATGGIGPVEYAWYSGPCPQGDPTFAPANQAIPAGFTLIEGANGESYDPPFTEETTCYIRVARNEGCEDYIGESNVITITVHSGLTVDVEITGGATPSCDGEVVELTAVASASVMYDWSTGATTSSIEVTESGVYTVIVVDENECSTSDSIEIEILPNPEVEIEITGNNPLCEGDSVLLTANCATAVGYVWSTGSTDESIWVTETGVYSVEVEDENGCTAEASEEVEVLELPDVEITVDGNNPLCAGDSALLTAVSQGAMSYEWSNGATTQSIWVYEAGTYTVTVVEETGCENSTSIEIEEGLTPLIEIVGDTVTCAGESITLTAEYAGGEAVLWSTGATTQSITVTEAGEYCVMTASIDGCEAEACISIDFYPETEVDIEITAGSNPLCPGSEVELTAVSTNAATYEWSTSENTSSIVVTEAGTYTVEVVDENGCTGSASIEIEEGLVPLIEIEGVPEFCTGDSTMLTAQYAGGEGVTWSTGETTQSIWVSEAGEYCAVTVSVDGCEAEACIEVEEAEIPEVYAGEDVNICVGQSTMLTATGGSVGTTYTWYVDGEEVGTGATIIVEPGIGLTEYTVVAVNENCSIEAEDLVKVWVYEYPIAGFERDPAGDVPFGSEIQFTDTSLGVVTDWYWNFGDGMTSMLQNPSHNYDAPGSYWVELIAANNGCEDTARAGLEVKIIIDIPNVFTPNNDGVNDQIWLQGTDLEMITMTVFNRWGHSVWTAEGRQFSWNGKNSSGGDCEAGTYYYVIEMKYKDGNIAEQTGFFTLIRKQ